jgi:hypothetical protein
MRPSLPRHSLRAARHLFSARTRPRRGRPTTRRSLPRPPRWSPTASPTCRSKSDGGTMSSRFSTCPRAGCSTRSLPCATRSRRRCGRGLRPTARRASFRRSSCKPRRRSRSPGSLVRRRLRGRLRPSQSQRRSSKRPSQPPGLTHPSSARSGFRGRPGSRPRLGPPPILVSKHVAFCSCPNFSAWQGRASARTSFRWRRARFLRVTRWPTGRRGPFPSGNAISARWQSCSTPKVARRPASAA